MQRVRIGLTGLACVFLLVLLAAAFFGLTNNEQTTGPLTVPAATSAATAGEAPPPPHEPLAELGVTPGFAGEEPVANAAVPPPPGAAHGETPPGPALR